MKPTLTEDAVRGRHKNHLSDDGVYDIFVCGDAPLLSWQNQTWEKLCILLTLQYKSVFLFCFAFPPYLALTQNVSSTWVM